MEFITKSKNETIALAKRLGHFLKAGDFLALKGDLAGGKTTFTKGLGLALDIHEVINSPTFNILKIYHGKIDLYHIDAYRLENNDYDLGFEDLMDEGLTVCEWPEYFLAYLPENYLTVEFTYLDENTRRLTFEAKGKHYEEILKEFKDADAMS